MDLRVYMCTHTAWWSSRSRPQVKLSSRRISPQTILGCHQPESIGHVTVYCERNLSLPSAWLRLLAVFLCNCLTLMWHLLIIRFSAVGSDAPQMANNEFRPRARQHEQIVSNKVPTTCKMALEKILGHYLSHATNAVHDYRHLALCPHLTELPVDPSHERGRPHGIASLVFGSGCCSVIHVLRVRGASVAPNLCFAEHTKHCQ